ncbi:tRNA preQ1(34) S-adenosylmethionine ribosyltransferase-isomerase QueA [soil metagenome]
MKLSELDFDYPEDLVATERVSPSRTLLVDLGANSGHGAGARELTRTQLLDLFGPGDLWVVNQTRVLKRRVFTKQNLEILFIKPLNAERTDWEVLCPSSRWKQGTQQTVGSVSLELTERGRPQKLRSSVSLFEDFFEEAGELPLPPYIQKARGERHTRTEDDREYQSLWAETPGSLAAPTASFHFDDDFVSELKKRGVEIATVTLHVGLGTFLPVTVENLDDHVMHSEVAEISKATQDAVTRTKKAGGRVIAVGTTVTRTLESWAAGIFAQNAASPDTSGTLRGETALLIRPGYEWKVVDVLLTNFHQPKSTLFALVAAFSDLESVRRAYSYAIENRFRLFSYGDLSVWMTARDR